MRAGPDPSVPAQRVAFGTSGHRGCSLDNSFNEAHILAITQAICLNRKQQRIDGPLYIGFDTHALSAPAFKSALEVPRVFRNGERLQGRCGKVYTHAGDLACDSRLKPRPKSWTLAESAGRHHAVASPPGHGG